MKGKHIKKELPNIDEGLRWYIWWVELISKTHFFLFFSVIMIIFHHSLFVLFYFLAESHRLVILVWIDVLKYLQIYIHQGFYGNG